MAIPKIIHQTWKNHEIPNKWKAYQQKVKQLHPDWEYRLWTDDDNDLFVKTEYPEFYNTYIGFSKNIMRADVIRYLIMYKIGGLYLDLDYEMLMPFDLLNETLVLPKNRSISEGDDYDGIGNCIFASAPGHEFWKDVINELQNNPPVIDNYNEVIDATGPMLLTRIFFSNKYHAIYTPERTAFHPEPPKNKNDYNKLYNNGITYGIHHGWGSWKERFTFYHISRKLQQWFK
jgi:mannosyltransferase OCH1-like enzyme